MKTVILAGGFGTRFSEETHKIPKPMIKINNRPILFHIMNIYRKYGYNEFCLALGYKAELVNNYLLNNGFKKIDDDQSIKFPGLINMRQDSQCVTTVDTGLNTMTGGRLKRLKKIIGDDTFMLTYGDGVADININELIDFHKSHGKMVTVTAVHPIARFGELQIENNMVKNFREKPQTNNDWINGGFFVINPEFIDLIESDATIMERYPLEKISSMNELMAYKHPGFWHCMDTKRDKDFLEELANKKEAKWI
mgnify:CR=1 FL=1